MLVAVSLEEPVVSPLARPSTWKKPVKIAVLVAVVVLVVGGVVALSLPSGSSSSGHKVTVQVTGPVNTTYHVASPGLVDTGSDKLVAQYSQVFETATAPEALNLVVSGTTYGYYGDVNLPSPSCTVTIDGRQVAHQVVAPQRATGFDQFECRVGG